MCPRLDETIQVEDSKIMVSPDSMSDSISNSVSNNNRSTIRRDNKVLFSPERIRTDLENDENVPSIATPRRRNRRELLVHARDRIMKDARDFRHRSRVFFQKEMELRRQKLQQRSRVIIIPADHPLKITWDIFTVILTFLSAYSTHTSIRDRNYSFNSFVIFTELWLLVDLLLNFITEHRSSDGKVLRDQKVVWARYLTTWFAIDALSLIPWERVYVKPVIEMQNKRGIIQKSFFRTKAVIRVTRFLRGKHFRYFGKVVNNTKHVGVGAHRLLRLIIKYVPKYILFYRNMRGVLAVRTLRQIHIMRKLFKRIGSTSSYSSSSDNSQSSINNTNIRVPTKEHYLERTKSS